MSYSDNRETFQCIQADTHKPVHALRDDSDRRTVCGCWIPTGVTSLRLGADINCRLCRGLLALGAQEAPEKPKNNQEIHNVRNRRSGAAH